MAQLERPTSADNTQLLIVVAVLLVVCLCACMVVAIAAFTILGPTASSTFSTIPAAVTPGFATAPASLP